MLTAASVHTLTQGPVAAPPETAAGLLAPAPPRTHVHTHGSRKGPVTMESGHITRVQEGCTEGVARRGRTAAPRAAQTPRLAGWGPGHVTRLLSASAFASVLCAERDHWHSQGVVGRGKRRMLSKGLMPDI